MRTNLPYVYAAILDVLGYRQRLEEDRNKASLDFKDELHRALQSLNTFNEATYSYQAISDTIILTCSDRDNFIEFLQVLKEIMIAFLKENLFIRGGVAYSQHFKSGQITYSHAIAKAHEIESNMALYPRIVVDHNIIEMFKSSNDISDLINSNLVCILNSAYFINILDEYNWREVYLCARKLYEHDKEFLLKHEVEFSKHDWFENYIFTSPYADQSFNRYIPQIRLLEFD